MHLCACVFVCVEWTGSIQTDELILKCFTTLPLAFCNDILVNVLLLPGTFNITHACEIKKHLLFDDPFFFFFDFPIVDVNKKRETIMSIP